MKLYSFILFSFLLNTFFSQKINYINFNSDSLNKLVLKRLNEFRISHGVDPLVYSNVLHNQITRINCYEVSKTNTLYHPNVSPIILNTNFKNDIGNESLQKIGGVLSIGSPSMKPRLDYSENCFRANNDPSTSNFGFNTYEEIVDLAIYRWENSPLHAEAQLRDYSSQNLPGMFACHSIMMPDGVVYVFVNFVKLHRRSTL